MTLTECLRGGHQCDEDGTEIIMSRRACVEAADAIERLEHEIAAAVPSMREYAGKNPIYRHLNTLQDPNGVHAWLERNDNVTPNVEVSGDAPLFGAAPPERRVRSHSEGD